MLWPVAPSGRPQPTTTSSTSVGSMPALDRMTQHVRRHRDAVGLVQRAPNGACDARPAIGDDGDTFMSLPPVRSPYHAASTGPRHGGTTPMAANDRSIASGVPQSLQ